jgi:hypothetical protein
MVNASGDQPKAKEVEISRTLQKLPGLTVRVLKVKYREIFGEEARIGHKEYLLRRIGWQLQASADGNLSERARDRITEIADLADIRPGKPTTSLIATPRPSEPLSIATSSHTPCDPRLPPVGTLLRRHYKGREIVVRVLDQGFEYDSERYRSLSAIARHVTGTRWNGLLFFGLTERQYA